MVITLLIFLQPKRQNFLPKCSFSPLFCLILEITKNRDELQKTQHDMLKFVVIDNRKSNSSNSSQETESFKSAAEELDKLQSNKFIDIISPTVLEYKRSPSNDSAIKIKHPPRPPDSLSSCNQTMSEHDDDVISVFRDKLTEMEIEHIKQIVETSKIHLLNSNELSDFRLFLRKIPPSVAAAAGWRITTANSLQNAQLEGKQINAELREKIIKLLKELRKAMVAEANFHTIGALSE